MTEEHYAPETTLYFESQKSFDDLTIQNKIKYHFEKHHFSNITFSADNIVGNLKNCTFRNCAFINFDGENISFENASFNNCRIINSNLKKCNFERAGMAYLQIINSDFTDANFAAAKIGDTRFDRNDLSGVKFHGATLDDVIITDTTVDKPIEGLYSENISMDGATLQELEASRNRIFSELKLEPLSFEQTAEQAKASLEPLPNSEPDVKFMWNGIKIDGVLYKGTYYSGSYKGVPEGSITVSMDRSNTPRIEGLEIENNSDIMTDYFEKDFVIIRPDSIYYNAAVKASNDYQIRLEKKAINQYEKLAAKRIGTPMEEQYKQEIERHKAALEKLQNQQTAKNSESALETAPKNVESVTQQTVDKLNIYGITFDDENYLHFNIDADGYRLNGYFRVFDPSNGDSMEIVRIENYDSHPVISEHWNDIEQQCKVAATERYNELVKSEQFKIISAVNPAPNTYQTWIRSADDIKNFEETLKDSDWEGWEQNGFDESYTPQVVQDALNSGKITVYSSHPIKQGVFVTPSPMEAQSYSGDGKIYSKEVNLNAVAWIDPTQGQYANVEEYAAQMVEEPVIVARYKEQDAINVIMQYPNGLYYNHYGYDAEKNMSDSNAGGYKTLDEAKEIMLKHRSSAIEEPLQTKILESSIPIELPDVPHMTLDEFLASRGLASPVDDFMIDKLKLPHGQSKYDERKMHENARKSSQEYHSMRNAAIKEYQEKVAAGEIIEPSLDERYIKKAMGNPDKQSVQAARRVLEKRGYIQNENGEWIKPAEVQAQAAEPTLAEQKIAEVKEKLSNPQIPTKPLTNEEFDILKGEIVDIAKNYQADPKLAAELFAFKTQFYQYSLNNALLIHLQNPHATFVASFTKWKSMGYSIKKGAKHMKISRPIEIAKFPREVNGKTKMIDVKNASSEEKAKIASGEIKVEKVTKFVPHQVFDISQTTCPPEDYPKIYSMGVPDIEKAQLYECIAEYAKDSGFSVTEEDMSSISLDGYYKPSDDSIHINSLLQDSKKLETMAHELAHGVLHKTTTQPTEIAEFEAESFGTMLQRKLGIPVSEDSKRYIKNYFDKSSSLTKAKFDMNDTLNRLSKAFKHVSTGIDNKIEEMGYGAPREQGRSLSQAKAQAVDPVKISSNFTQAL